MHTSVGSLQVADFAAVTRCGVPCTCAGSAWRPYHCKPFTHHSANASDPFDSNCCCVTLSHCHALQLRLKCLETLLQLLTLIQADAAATAAFKSAAAAPTAAQQQQTDSSVSSSSSALAGLVSGCLSGVSASDPSAAHKALAAQAAAVLQKIA